VPLCSSCMVLCLSMETLNPSKAKVAIVSFSLVEVLTPWPIGSPHTLTVRPVIALPQLSQLSEAPIMLVRPLRPDRPLHHSPFTLSPPVTGQHPRCSNSLSVPRPGPAKTASQGTSTTALSLEQSAPSCPLCPPRLRQFFHAYYQLLLLIPGSALAGKMHLNF
jgi:hypothetical protein